MQNRHVPSIDLTSVLSPEALAANSDKPRKPSAGSFAQGHNAMFDTDPIQNSRYISLQGRNILRCRGGHTED
jgi:hypothetical protein